MPVPLWTATFTDTDDLSSVEFLQMFADAVRKRILAAGLECFRGGMLVDFSGSPLTLHYSVSAVMADGETALSTAATITPTPYAFWNPQSSSGIWRGCGVTLNWTAVSGAKYYKLYRQSGSLANEVILRTAATTWTDNGTNQAGVWPQDNNLSGGAGESSTPAPTGLTAALTASTPAWTVSVGDDVQLASQSVWTSLGDPIGYWTTYIGLGSNGNTSLSTVSGCQAIAQALMSQYADTTVSVVNSVNRLLTNLDDPIHGDGHTTVIEALMSVPYIWENNIGFPWRRRRPREVYDLSSTQANTEYLKISGFSAYMSSYGTATTGMKANYLGFTNAGPRYVVQFDGTAWVRMTDQLGNRADILDSYNDPASGNACPPGLMTHGDFIGPWLFNQLRDALVFMTRTSLSGNGAEFQWPWQFTPATILDPSDTVPTSTPATIMTGQYLFTSGSSSGTDTSAAAAFAGAVGNESTPSDILFPTSSNPPRQFSAIQDNGDGTFSAEVDVSSWKWCLQWNWSGVASSVNFVCAAWAPINPYDSTTGTYVNSMASGIPVSPNPIANYWDVVWGIFETKAVAAGDGTFKTVSGSTEFNSALAATPLTAAGCAGQNLFGFGYVVDWTFADG